VFILFFTLTTLNDILCWVLRSPGIRMSELDRVDIICISLAAVLTFAKPFQQLMLYNGFRQKFGTFSEVLDKQARLCDRQQQSRGGAYAQLVGDDAKADAYGRS